MSLTVEVCFPLGRVHATPWDRHVNEGAVEWPVSPWRLSRALYAVWKDRLPELPEDDVHAVLRALAEPPSYVVPPFTESSTRHYYPASDHAPGTKISTDKIIDSFVAVHPSTPLVIHWPEADLSTSERRAATDLIAALPFLGRADSACDARVVDTGSTNGTALHPTPDGNLRLSTPRRPLDIDELTVTTGAMRKARLRSPIGMTWTTYDQPVPTRHREPTRPTSRRADDYTVVLFSVTGRPAPPETLIVAVADLFHKAAQRKFDDATGDAPPPKLSGHPADGDGPLRTGHRHLHVLPTRWRGASISELAAWAPGGFDDRELDALGRITLLRLERRSGDDAEAGRAVIRGLSRVHLVAAAVGDGQLLPHGFAGPSTTWRSVTPYLPTHHPKRRHADGKRIGPFTDTFLREEIERELGHRGYTAKVVELKELDRHDGGIPASRYRRYRVNQTMRDARPGVWLDMVLNEEVCGPVALGGLSHFGLGLFASEPLR